MSIYDVEKSIGNKLTAAYVEFSKLINLYNNSCYGRREIAAKALEKARIVKEQFEIINGDLSLGNFEYGAGKDKQSKLDYYFSQEIVLSVLIGVANKDIECFSIKSIIINCPNDDSLICGDLNVTLLVSGLDSAKFDEDREYSVEELVDIIRTCEGSIGIGAPCSYHNLHEQIYSQLRSPDHTFKVSGNATVGCFYGNDNLSNAVMYLENFVKEHGADFNYIHLKVIVDAIILFNENPDLARKRMPKIDLV